MNIDFLLRSIFIGFTLAAAVGPISMLVMQRTLARGWVVGMASGLGVAAADGLYGLAGGLGLTAIATALANYDAWVRGIGGLVLIYLGIKIFTSKAGQEIARDETDEREDPNGLIGAFLSIFMLTLANPNVILRQALWVGIFGSILLWLSYGRVYSLTLAIVLLMGLSAVEWLLRMRERSQWKP